MAEAWQHEAGDVMSRYHQKSTIQCISERSLVLSDNHRDSLNCAIYRKAVLQVENLLIMDLHMIVCLCDHINIHCSSPRSSSKECGLKYPDNLYVSD